MTADERFEIERYVYEKRIDRECMPPRDHLAPAVLRQGGFGSLARLIRPALADRCRRLALDRQPVPIETQFRLYTGLWAVHNRLRYEVPTSPWTTIEVDPAEVTHYVGDVELPWGLGRVHGGDWDRRSDRNRIDELPRYRGVVQHFNEGLGWEKTDYYEHLQERYADHDGPLPRGYDDFDSFWWNRREAHERLYRSVRDEGYRSNTTVDRDPETWGEFVHSLEPLVVIGRDGEVLWNEGFGRLIVAKLLGVESMPVYVLCRHERWQRVRERLHGTGCESWSPALEQHRDHPDMPAAAR